MAENENNQQDTTQQEEPDYKALYEQALKDSRKWESRSKANKEKADRWDAAAAGNDSLEERLAALESENQAMKDAEARRELVAKVAKAVGLSESIVANLTGTDEDTLTEQAKSIAALKPKGAPSAPEAGKFPRNDAEDEKRQLVRQLFGK